MALTLAQIQTNITNKMDARLILNQIADYLEANPGGGGSGMVLESYENSAMSAPVMAYVFRDADDNIFEVYEPIKGNRVSRSQLSYADSIDKFPFDNEDCFENTIIDTKLLNLASDFIIKFSTLETTIINATNKDGFQIKNCKIKNDLGNVGLTPNAAFIYLAGNDVVFERIISTLCFFDSLPLGSYIYDSVFHSGKENLGFIKFTGGQIPASFEVSDFWTFQMQLTVTPSGADQISGNNAHVFDSDITLTNGGYIDGGHFYRTTTIFDGASGNNLIIMNRNVLVQSNVANRVYLNAASATDYYAEDSPGNYVQGVDGSFTAQSGETITVTKGIITAITPP